MDVPVGSFTKKKVFEQYRLLIEDTSRLSDRRQTVINIHLSANAVILGGLALLTQQSLLQNALATFLSLLIALVGIAICFTWRRLIKTYRELINLRIGLLKEIESRPDFGDLIQIYHREDALYAPANPGTRIFGFSHIEGRLPILFINLYWLAMVGAVVFGYPQIVTQFATWGVMLPKP